jgi:hypothetical protein
MGVVDEAANNIEVTEEVMIGPGLIDLRELEEEEETLHLEFAETSSTLVSAISKTASSNMKRVVLVVATMGDRNTVEEEEVEVEEVKVIIRVVALKSKCNPLCLKLHQDSQFLCR